MMGAGGGRDAGDLSSCCQRLFAARSTQARSAKGWGSGGVVDSVAVVRFSEATKESVDDDDTGGGHDRPRPLSPLLPSACSASSKMEESTVVDGPKEVAAASSTTLSMDPSRQIRSVRW